MEFTTEKTVLVGNEHGGRITVNTENNGFTQIERSPIITTEVVEDNTSMIQQ